MSKANIFLLLPETEPTTNWSKSNERIQSEEGFQRFIRNKVAEISLIEQENFEGYYDNLNLKNFFSHFDMLEDFYPRVKRQLLRKLSGWENWRTQTLQKEEGTYKLFEQNIPKHSLPEIAERKKSKPDESFALLNNSALTIQNTTVSVNVVNKVIQIDILKNTEELKTWFAKNRIPPRKFHIISKHGENGKGNWKSASPLMCSEQEAQVLLNTSIGESTDRLFNYDIDKKMFIVFWSENEPKNQYHGYHLPETTLEVPSKIKKILLS